MPDCYTHTSAKNGHTYFLNRRTFNKREYVYFAKEAKEPVKELPAYYTVVEAKNGVPMVARIQT